jgi:hypothetical protein
MAVAKFKNPKILIACGGVLVLAIVTVLLIIFAPKNTCEICVDLEKCVCGTFVGITTEEESFDTAEPPACDCEQDPCVCDTAVCPYGRPPERRFTVIDGEPIMVLDSAENNLPIDDENVTVNPDDTITVRAPNAQGEMTTYTFANPLIIPAFTDAPSTDEPPGTGTQPPPATSVAIATLPDGGTTQIVVTIPVTTTRPPATTPTPSGFQGITLSSSSISANVAGVVIEDLTDESGRVVASRSVARITAPGTYVVTGTISNGQIVVDTAGRVNVILRNASITCRVGPALRGANIDGMNLTVTSENGTTNALVDARSVRPDLDQDIEPQTDDPAWRNSALHFRNEDSSSSLTITGNGRLTIRGGYQHGINSRSSLTVNGARLTIESASHGMRSRLGMTISTRSEITITSGRRGLRAAGNNNGSITVRDSTLTINSRRDAIHAEAHVTLLNATVNATVYGGWNQRVPDDYSTRGIRAGGSQVAGAVNITGGNVTISSPHNAIAARGDVNIRSSATLSLSTQRRGLFSSLNVNINSSNVTIVVCSEGIRTTNLVVSQGNVRIHSRGVGINLRTGGRSNINPTNAVTHTECRGCHG